MGNQPTAQSGPRGIPAPPVSGNPMPHGSRVMSQTLTQRFRTAKERNTYNMKVVIRGDRQTGKSALLHRLEGGGFTAEHKPTPQIQTAHVPWTYKTTDEMVKLEVWDVVDVAQVPSFSDDDRKPEHISAHLLPADASSVDVYKGADAIIFLVDPTRKWTLDYVTTHIINVPPNVDLLILFTKKDLNQYWTVSKTEIETFLGKLPPKTRHLDVSIKDCFGMKELHTFFSVPFLRMKCKCLEKELNRAKLELEQSQTEVDLLIKHHDYANFLARQRSSANRRREQPNTPTAPISPPPNASTPTPGTQQNIGIHAQLTHGPKSDSPQVAIPSAVPPPSQIDASESPDRLPAPRVKQTVHSSKDLPLIQQQLEREKQQQTKLSVSPISLKRPQTPPVGLSQSASPRHLSPAASAGLPRAKTPQQMVVVNTNKRPPPPRQAPPRLGDDNLDSFKAGTLDDDFFGDAETPPGEDESTASDNSRDEEDQVSEEEEEPESPKNKHAIARPKKIVPIEEFDDSDISDSDQQETRQEKKKKQEEAPKPKKKAASPPKPVSQAKAAPPPKESPVNAPQEPPVSGSTKSTIQASTKIPLAPPKPTIGSDSESTSVDGFGGFDVDPDEPLPEMSGDEQESDHHNDLAFARMPDMKIEDKPEQPEDQPDEEEDADASPKQDSYERSPSSKHNKPGKLQTLIDVESDLDSSELDLSDSESFDEPLVLTTKTTVAAPLHPTSSHKHETPFTGLPAPKKEAASVFLSSLAAASSNPTPPKTTTPLSSSIDDAPKKDPSPPSDPPPSDAKEEEPTEEPTIENEPIEVLQVEEPKPVEEEKAAEPSATDAPEESPKPESTDEPINTADTASEEPNTGDPPANEPTEEEKTPPEPSEQSSKKSRKKRKKKNRKKNREHDDTQTEVMES